MRRVDRVPTPDVAPTADVNRPDPGCDDASDDHRRVDIHQFPTTDTNQKVTIMINSIHPDLHLDLIRAERAEQFRHAEQLHAISEQRAVHRWPRRRRR